jgi:hypothetical protein
VGVYAFGTNKSMKGSFLYLQTKVLFGRLVLVCSRPKQPLVGLNRPRSEATERHPL